ncbi:hypothetical protein BATDEDRAFT_35354 [Batrachochytrium dendrobatidis JAM81]|uniref:Uncharacterized protein n=2 Tax=Batrachochytrium dendrobatidis TaxID=109871 RepID=F4P5C2_BATDJ|nr:uncharacterized protein BATDEDRAFT_35354 [Batrachochytrium dendrobatidis JAM81]EGF79167.1 hypothetical protein BATDEDRAFT_35354 [Batrachochytrium dendrobatidis JAM81]OAJ43853.1 hypothetical protein BDEG_27166 [Batrachochytrium dendrobatidis JEL423]|eukprot:XP_006679975.1 hypothetical protein BATDEDRAFT_35354 [Batrachochytrium dendrobatidis JAM81]
MNSQVDSHVPSFQQLADLENTIIYVNRELIGLGLSDSLCFNVTAESHDRVKTIVACIFSLLQQRQRDSSFRTDMQERLHYLMTDNDALSASINRFKATEESLKRQIASFKNKLSSATKTTDSTIAKLAAVKEELKTALTAQQYSKAQYAHELKRKTLEFGRLQQRLQKIVAEKSLAKAGITLANPIKSASSMGDGSQSLKQDHSEEMYSIVIKNYEDREKHIMAENDSLRQTLFQVFNEMKGYIEQHQDQFLSGQIQQLRPEIMLAHSPNTLKHPLQEAIEQGLNVLGSIQTGVSTELVTEMKSQVDCLTKQNNEQTQVIQEQTRLLEMALNQDFSASPPDENDSFATGMEDSEHQRTELQEQWSQLENERRKFTDAAIRMGLERAALQHEREKFEEEKRSHQTMQFLGTLPPTPAWLKTSVAAAAEASEHHRDSKGTDLMDQFRRVDINRFEDDTVKPTLTDTVSDKQPSIYLEGASKDDFLVESDTLMSTHTTARTTHMGTPTTYMDALSKSHILGSTTGSAKKLLSHGRFNNVVDDNEGNTVSKHTHTSKQTSPVVRRSGISSGPALSNVSPASRRSTNTTPMVKSAFRNKTVVSGNSLGSFQSANASSTGRSVRISVTNDHTNDETSKHKNESTPFKPTLAMSTPS